MSLNRIKTSAVRSKFIAIKSRVSKFIIAALTFLISRWMIIILGAPVIMPWIKTTYEPDKISCRNWYCVSLAFVVMFSIQFLLTGLYASVRMRSFRTKNKHTNISSDFMMLAQGFFFFFCFKYGLFTRRSKHKLTLLMLFTNTFYTWSITNYHYQNMKLTMW